MHPIELADDNFVNRALALFKGIITRISQTIQECNNYKVVAKVALFVFKVSASARRFNVINGSSRSRPSFGFVAAVVTSTAYGGAATFY